MATNAPAQVLRGDLDNIIGKALNADRHRDLEHALAGSRNPERQLASRLSAR